MKPILLFLVFAVGFSLVAPQDVAAQDLLREIDIYRDGDPTDPERVLQNLEEAEIDAESHGILSALSDSLDFDEWIQQVFAALRSLGRMGAPEPGP